MRRNLGSNDHDAGDHVPATVAAAHLARLTIPASTLRANTSRYQAFQLTISASWQSSNVNIAHHVDKWVSPCTPPPPSNNRLGDAACPLEGTWHMHGRSHRAGATHMHTHQPVTTKRPRRWLACDRCPPSTFAHAWRASVAVHYRLHEGTTARTSMHRVPCPKWVALFRMETAWRGERSIPRMNCASGRVKYEERRFRPEKW